MGYFMSDMPLLTQTLTKRDPLFAKLTPEQKTIVTQKLISRPGTLYRILYTRDPAFKELNGHQRKQVIDKFVSDYKNLTQQSIQKTKQAAAFEQATAPDLSSAASLFLGNTFIDPVAAITAGAVGTLGAAKAGLSASRALLSGAVASGADVPVGVGSEAILDKVFKSNIPTPIKIGLGLVVPLALGATVAKTFEGKLQDAITNEADKKAFSKIKSAIFDKAKAKKITLEDLQSVVDKEIKNPEAGKVIDLVLRDPNVSDNFKKTVYALPDYAYEFVKPEFRRDLPILSKAQPMQENISEINRIARESFIEPTKKIALPESPITKGEVVPEGTIIPAGGAKVEKPVEPPVEVIKVKVTPQQPKELPEEVKLAAQELLDRGGAKDINEAIKKVSEVYDPQKDDIFSLVGKLDDILAQTPEMQKYYADQAKAIKNMRTDLYEKIRDILYEDGINSKDLNTQFGQTGLQAIRSKFGFRAVKKDGLPLDILGQTIRELYPELLPEDFDINDVYKLLEEIPARREIERDYNKALSVKEKQKATRGDYATKRTVSPLSLQNWVESQTKVPEYSKLRTAETALYRVKAPGKISKESAAAIAQKIIGDETQENLIAIAVDKNNKPIRIIHSTKGTRDTSMVDLSSLFGRALSDKRVKGIYVFHNHPGGSLSFSGHDDVVFKYMNKLSKDLGIKLEGFGIVSKEGAAFKGENKLASITNKEFSRSIPLTTRKFIASKEITSVSSPADVEKFVKENNIKNSIIYVDNNNNIVGVKSITPAKKGYTERSLLKDIITGSEEFGANRVIFANLNNKLIPAAKKITSVLHSDSSFGVNMLDMIRNNKSLLSAGKFNPSQMKSYDYLATELHAGPNLIKGLQQTDELVKNVMQKIYTKLEGKKAFKKIYQTLKSFSHPLPHLSKESVERYETALYGKYRPKEALGAIETKQLSKTIKRLLKDYGKERQTATEVIIRYLEDPVFREVARQKKEFKGLTKGLDEIVNAIDRTSNELMQRGIITPSQRKKWQRRYLARLYMQDKLSGVSSVGGVTQQKIYKGRKIESIMDLAKKDRDALGYIEDPELAVKTTLAKNWHNIATDDFYREIIKDKTIVPQEFIVKNPFKVENLPELMSPKYAKEKVIPWLRDHFREELKTNKALREKFVNFIKETNKKLNLIESVKNKLPKDYEMLSGEGVKYGILTDLPVHKDVNLQIRGMWSVTNEPENFLSKADKTLSTLYALFKVMKVPFNLRAYPRNFISNIFQYGLEGHNPIEYIKEMPDTIRGIITKDKYFDEALRMGLIGENFARHEIIDVLSKLEQSTSKNKAIKNILEYFQKASAPYGWVDDFAKLNTYRIFREKGLSKLEAIRKAQQIHYDYGYVPYWVRQIRQPKLEGKGIAGKLLMSPFVTFQSKATGQLFRSLANKPVTTAMLISSLYVLKNKIQQYYKKKYGKKYEVGEKLRPEWLKDPLIVHIMTKNGKHYYVDITQILPVGWLSKAIYEASHGKIASALGELGFGSSPLNAPFEAITGKDIFTGKELYSPLDTENQKLLKGISHVAKKTLAPATIEQIESWRKSKQPVFLRWITGANIYGYDVPELAAQAIYRKKKLEGAYKKELYSLRYKYQKGLLDKKEYMKKVKKLYNAYKNRTKELVAP